MALDATPGASTANSYLTVAEANAYFATRLNSEVWTDSDAQDVALMMATRLLDAKVPWTGTVMIPRLSDELVPWTGTPVDSIQALSWPRNGMLTRNGFLIPNTVIPQELKNATAELALWLLRKDRTNDVGLSGTQAIKRLKAGPMEIEYADAETTAKFNALEIPEGVLALLVPSWWTAVVEAAAVFEVF